MQNKKWLPLLFTLLGWTCSLQAEIEQITITWNAVKCQESCVAQIEQNVSAIKGVVNLKVNPGIGSATMQWSPDQQFSYEPFRYAAAAVGIRIINMYVRVKGTITHDTQNVYLVSNGDRTSFQLIGPIQTQPGRYIPNYSLDTHPLTSNLSEKLIEAEHHRWTVVISGPLYMPSRFPRLLVVEKTEVNPDEIQQKDHR